MATDQLPALPVEPSGLLHRDDGYYTWTKGREPQRMTGETYRMPFFTEADVRAAIAADRARAVTVELERNVQPSINLSVQMPKIELQDPELDATDPHTRLLLLAEYWKREAMRHKDHADTQREELLRTWHVLHTFGTHPGRTDDRLADCVRNALMARPPAPEQPAESKHRPSREWYAAMIKDTLDDDFVIGPPADLSIQAAGEREAFEAWLDGPADGVRGHVATRRMSMTAQGRADAELGWMARASLSTPASGEGCRPTKQAPESPEMGEGWSVTVSRHGVMELTISDEHYSGGRDIDEGLIVGAAQHLLAFVGYGLPPGPFDPFDADAAPTSPTEPAAPLKRCAANRDGDCVHAQCPQLRDGEPRATRRHCPLDTEPAAAMGGKA